MKIRILRFDVTGAVMVDSWDDALYILRAYTLYRWTIHKSAGMRLVTVTVDWKRAE